MTNTEDRLRRQEAPKRELPKRLRELPAKLKDYEAYPAKVPPIPSLKEAMNMQLKQRRSVKNYCQEQS